MNFRIVVVGHSAGGHKYRVPRSKFERFYFDLSGSHQEMQLQGPAERGKTLILSGNQVDAEISFIIVARSGIAHAAGQALALEVERDFLLIQQQLGVVDL